MDPSDAAADDDAVRGFIERFALLLTEAGAPRMPARVFACVLVEDAGRLTAAELAARLDASPAAISGAVRYLTQTGMLVRGRQPGARRDHYAVHEGVWTDMYASRAHLMRRWEQAAAEGVEVLGTDRPAGRRLLETRRYFAFLQEELPRINDRWKQHKQEHGF
jgi:DNA-binding transcriptional regulator GbsR (MarR family)